MIPFKLFWYKLELKVVELLLRYTGSRIKLVRRRVDELGEEIDRRRGRD